MLERICYLCDQRGISIRTLESNLGFGNGSIKKTNDSTGVMRVYQIAHYFGVSVEYLLTGIEIENHYSESETSLIKSVRALNQSGLSKLFDFLDMLLRLPEYQKGQKSLGSNVG